MTPSQEYRLLERAARVRRLKSECVRQGVKNIMLLIELETIAEDPTSDKAKKIISKYREKIDRRKEIDLAEQN